MQFRRTLLVLFLISFTGMLMAQYRYASAQFRITVAPASVIRIFPVVPISLNMGPSIAGSTASNQTNDVTYLQVTTINAGSSLKNIQVQITGGMIPAGTLLKVKASPCTIGTGSGTFGSVSVQRTLSSTLSQTLVSGIGSCYTGNELNQGYKLTYSWELDPNNLVNLKAYTTAGAFVTYTISSW